MSQLLTASLVAFGAALVLTPAAKQFARRAGAVARPKADRWHRGEIPLMGGVAIGLSLLVALPLVSQSLSPSAWILLAGAYVMLGVGLLDDIRPLRPQSKLVLQIVVAAVVSSQGLQLRLTPYPATDILLTIGWVVAITNAINLLDNMDGLAVGISAIAVAFRLLFFVLDGNVEGALLAAALLGALLGFLRFNFNPASIFMGDAGSLFLGLMVSGLSLVGGWPYSRSTLSILLFPVLILLVPIFDTTFVSLARSLSGRSIARGGRDHTSHRLVALGLSERRAVLVLYALALVSGGLAYVGYRVGLRYAVVLVGFFLIGLGLLGVHLGRLKMYSDDGPEAATNRAVTRLLEVPYKRQIAAVLMDTCLIVMAYYSAYLLRFEGGVGAEEPQFVWSLPIVLTCQLSAFALWRTYQGIWRYSGLSDVMRLVKASTTGTAAAVLVLLALTRFEGYSRAVFVLDLILLVAFVSASRFSFRAMAGALPGHSHPRRPVVIFGAGDFGELVWRALSADPKLGYEVIAFLDDDGSKHRTRIHGVPVIGDRSCLGGLTEDHGVNTVILAATGMSDDEVMGLHALCSREGLTLRRADLRLV